MDVKAIKRTRNIYLYVSAISLLVLGLIYAWSLFATPLATTYSWDPEAVKVTFTICMIAFCCGGLMGVPVLKRLDVKGAVGLAAIMLVFGFAGTALLAPQGIWALYICYGVFVGAGAGMGYNVVVASVTNWYPDKPGYASGIMMMGLGLGALILGTVANVIIEVVGLTPALFVIAAMGGCFMGLLAILIKRPPENIAEILGVETEEEEIVVTEEQSSRNILTDSAFYLYYVWAILVIGAGLVMIGTSKQGALELGVDPTIATTLVGIISLMNGISRLIMGMIYDRTSVQFVLTLDAVIAMVASGVMIASFAFDLGVPYIIGCLLLVFSYGSVLPIAAAFARARYGARTFAKNLAIVNTDIAFASLYQQIVTTASAGVNILIYTAMTVGSAIAVAVSFVIRKLMK